MAHISPPTGPREYPQRASWAIALPRRAAGPILSSVAQAIRQGSARYGGGPSYRGGGSFFGRRPITKGALYLLIITSAASLGFLFLRGAVGLEARHALEASLFASPAGLWLEGRLWLLLTGPLVEPDFIGLVFQALMLWIFLPALESWWGTKRFIQFAAITSIAAVVVGTLAGLVIAPDPYAPVITGLRAFVFSGIVAYGVLFSQHKVHFFGVVPMTGKQLTIGIVGFMAAFIVIGQQWAEGAGYAGAMVIAWGMASGRLTPHLWYLKAKQRWIRRRLKVVRGRRGGDGGGWLN